MTDEHTPVRAFVLYESMFGNTEQVAHAVAEGLRQAGLDVAVGDVAWAPLGSPLKSDLLVLGAPTHAFSLSRPSTRKSAVDQGAPTIRQGVGLREWLTRKRNASGTRLPLVAVFDTRATKARHLPGAARAAARLARRRGFEVIGSPASFLVEDTPGPLLKEEPDYATAWGRALGDSLTARGAVRGPHDGTAHQAAAG